MCDLVSDCYYNVYTNLQSSVNVIAYKCTTIVRLSVDIEGCQSRVHCLDKRTILSFEAPSNGHLQSVDLCHLTKFCISIAYR